MTISSNFIIWSHSPEKTQMHHLVYRWAHCTIRCTVGSVYIQYVAYIYSLRHMVKTWIPIFWCNPPSLPINSSSLVPKIGNPFLHLVFALDGTWCMVHILRHLVRMARCIHCGIWCVEMPPMWYGMWYVSTTKRITMSISATKIKMPFFVICVNNRADPNVDFWHKDRDALICYCVSPRKLTSGIFFR